MQPTPNLIAQCINIGSGLTPPPGGICAAGMTKQLGKCYSTICGPIPTVAGPGVPVGTDGLTLGWLIGVIMGYVYPFAGILLFFFISSAGYDYILSQGEPEKLTSAQSKMTYALIGIILLVASYMIVRVVGAVMGLDLPF